MVQHPHLFFRGSHSVCQSTGMSCAVVHLGFEIKYASDFQNQCRQLASLSIEVFMLLISDFCSILALITFLIFLVPISGLYFLNHLLHRMLILIGDLVINSLSYLKKKRTFKKTSSTRVNQSFVFKNAQFEAYCFISDLILIISSDWYNFDLFNQDILQY